MKNINKNINKKLSKVGYEDERFRLIFEYSPIAIWEEDFSVLAKLKRQFQKEGVTDIKAYLKKNVDVVKKTFCQIKVVDINKAAIALYGAKDKKDLLRNLGVTFRREVVVTLINEFTALLEGQQFFESEMRHRNLRGEMTDVLMRVSVPDMYQKTFKRVIITMQDISIQKKQERHLKRLAHVDGLTKLLNQQSINARLEHEFLRAKRYGADLSCLMIDLDFFKRVNDEYGHQKGNQVLRRVAMLLKQNLRVVDIAGRYGGDEFLILLPETSADMARLVAMRLHELFQPEYENQRKKINNFITLSIGISGFPAKGITTARALLTRVDKALYAAKKAGRNNVVTL